ncbi:hypothetical protein ACLOJK_025489 [Asimina triloba]
MLGWVEVSSSLGGGMEGVLIKVTIFIAVQVLLYLILISGSTSSSSGLFSKKARRRRARRLASILQSLNVLSDFPAGAESPSDYLQSRRGKKHHIHCSQKSSFPSHSD